MAVPLFIAGGSLALQFAGRAAISISAGVAADLAFNDIGKADEGSNFAPPPADDFSPGSGGNGW